MDHKVQIQTLGPGLYSLGQQYLIVNTPRIWGGWAFPGRLGMRPEITILEMDMSSIRTKFPCVELN